MIHARAIRLAAALAALVAAPPVRAFTAADTHTPLTATSALPGSIVLRGRIVAGSPALVRAALDRAGQAHPVVLIDSPGGAIDPALAIGRLVRARGLEVAVARAVDGRPTDDAQCASACVLVLAGGMSRSVGPRAAVGVHRLVDWTTYSRTWDVYRILRRAVGGRTVVVGRELLSRRILSSREVLTEVPPRAYAAVRTYLDEMGIASGLVALMQATPAARLHWMSAAELAATRIATDRRRPSPGSSRQG